MNQMFPDAINDDGTIDIVKIIGRGARKYRYFLMQLKNLDTTAGGSINVEEKQKIIENTLENLVNNPGFLDGSISSVANKRTSDYLRDELKTTGMRRGLDEISNPEIASAFYDSDVASTITQVVVY